MKLPRNQEFYSEYDAESEHGTFDVWTDPPAPKRRWIRRVRDSITGRFVHKEEAKSRPETTIEERTEYKPDGLR